MSPDTKDNPKQPTPKPGTRDYLMLTLYGKTIVYCFSSKNNRCTVKTRLLEAERSDFHDAELQNATQEINKVIDRVERNNKNPSRHLCFIAHENRLMLVWSEHGRVDSADADPDQMLKALRVKRSSR